MIDPQKMQILCGSSKGIADSYAKMTGSLFTEDFKTQPYWLEGQPELACTPELPKEVDVVIVGSGYTGLNAALPSSRAGFGTLVLDADKIGFGCSSRNGGQVSPLLKDSYQSLSKRYGEKLALGLFARWSSCHAVSG